MTNNMILFLSSVITKLKGKWIPLFYSSLIFGFLVSMLSVTIGINPIFAMPALAFVVVGQITFVRKALNDEELRLEDLFSEYKLFISAFLTLALTIMAISLGLILLIVPGIFAVIFYSFSLHALQEDKQAGALKALAKSKDLSQNHKFKIVLFYAMFLLILVALYGVSILIALPLKLIWGAGLFFGFSVWIIASLILTIITFIIIQPFFLASLTMLYDQIKQEEIEAKFRDSQETVEVEEVEVEKEE